MTKEQASSFLGKFQVALEKTKRCERSNSSRAKLFRILHETTARFDGDGGLTHDLRRTSAFDEDEGRFIGTVSRVLCGLDSTQNRVAAAEFIVLKLQALADDAVLRRAAEVVERRNANAKSVQLLIPVLAEFESEERLDRIFQRR
jgi:hypothetical protein